VAFNCTKFLSEAGYGEQEFYTNSAYIELDKGWSSNPKLFQNYPFPILINSAFLKLADIFRLGYRGL
uniref:Integrator complex subunit 7 N-terminal domain-containing protein n=1 Tax=Salmo trutta TaxID=8032 RepID=A0A674E5I0_SALTR